MTTDLTRREIMVAGAAATLVVVPGREDAMAAVQSEIKALLDSRFAGIRARDIERLMAVYSADIVYFDLVPPLQYAGSAALRARFLDWFGRWNTSIGQELREVNIVESGDVAWAHMLIRTSGTLKNGHEVGYWVRTTNGFRRSNHKWSITHEHVSLPVDLKTGEAVMDLVP
jgi:ketosteroid isomerase-like protein